MEALEEPQMVRHSGSTALPTLPVSPESIVPSLFFPSGPQISARKETVCWEVA